MVHGRRVRGGPAWMLGLLGLASALPCAAAGDTRVAEAVKRQDGPAVRALLQAGADVNGAQADGATALHWAVYQDDLALADVLLRAGARADAASDLQVTPVRLACDNGNGAMVARLLSAGGRAAAAPPAVPPLLACARAGTVSGVTALLGAGADVNAREPRAQQTALMWAASHDRADIVRLLLERGADPHARSRTTRRVVNRATPRDTNVAVVGAISEGGSTALMLAARQGAAAAARALLDGGARVDDVAPDGSTALILAAHSDQAAVAALLLERGANPNIIGPGYSALHAAVLRGNAALVQALVARRANVNSRLRHGTATTRGTHDYFFIEALTGATPAWLAARFLEPAILRTLITAGADWRLTPPDGTTALMAAAGIPAQPPLFDRRDRLRVLRTPDERPALEAVTVLLDLGADPNAVNADGDTALHGAAGQNYPTVSRRLIERGAAVHPANRAGLTPLAVANGPETAAALRALGATH